MRKSILVIVLVLVCGLMSAQTGNTNNVKSTAYQVEVQNETEIQNLAADDKLESISYYDGLGRPQQSISVGAGGQGEDIIAPMAYDAYGRQVKEYLPYARSNSSLNLEDPSSIIGSLESQYSIKYPEEANGQDITMFSESLLESSPLSRVLEQAAPGEDWKIGNGHTIKFSYQTNSFDAANPADAANDNVKLFSVAHPEDSGTENTEQTELIFDGYYAETELYKTVTKDENWSSGKNHTTEEFKNKQGQVILKRTYNQEQAHDTQYVYDAFGNLTYVIPPTASDQMVELGAQGYRVSSQNNYPWTELIEVNSEFAEDYNRRLEDYENEAILNADLENEYGGQGGFTVTTLNDSEVVTLSISFSANQELSLRQGAIVSLRDYGDFGDTELGRLSGADYEYIFTIKDNNILVSGSGELTTINQTLSSAIVLNYSKNYPWTSYTDVDSRFAGEYEGQLRPYENSQILNISLPNAHNGQGGVNVAIDDNDNISLTFNSSSSTAFKLKQGAVLPLDTERRLANRPLGNISGTGFNYTFTLEDNSILITGEGELTTFNGYTFSPPPPNPPTISNEAVEGLCYIYHYDYRNRLVEKKIPGKGWEHIVYDKLDRPVLTQDATQRISNHWLFTKYDALNRVIYTGRHYYTDNNISTSDRISLSNVINAQTKFSEARAYNADIVIGDVIIHHNNKVLPKENVKVYTVNYYDEYPEDIYSEIPSIGVFSLAGEDHGITANTRSLPVGSRVRVLGTSQWITSATYYDEKARPIYMGSKNAYLDTEDYVETALDFVGKVIETKSTHKKGTNFSIIVNDMFTYDRTGRLLTQSQSISGGATELIVNNHYDAHGQLTSKAVGGTVASIPTSSAGLQTVDYAYNIRGWLKTINDGTTASGDLFGFKLNYNTTDHTNTTKLYNGNISETHWVTTNDNQARSYGYSYDALNRIETADYHGNYLIEGTANEYEDYDLKRIAYDKNGNITSLIRLGLEVEESHVDVIDDLVYQYEALSNKLINVVDTAGADGFKDGEAEQEGDDYKYDINGNMVGDLNKGITNIEYNHLNLPTAIEFHYNDDGVAGAGVISYIYDATGVKMKKRTQEAVLSNSKHTYYAGNYIYEQGSEESPVVLKFFSQPEGYVQRNETTNAYDYVYQFKDHLGNIRLSYSDSDGDGIIVASSDPNTNEIVEENNYYPFGLKHKGYNNVINGIENNLKTYQGQELTKDLGLNVHEWKYRFGDPAIGRFWQIDPLADIYVYNSTYAFAENKLGLGIELEGLEIIPTYGMEYANAKTSQDYERIQHMKNMQAAGTTAGIAAWVAPAVVSAYGVRASATFVANEIKDEVLSRATNGASDVLDLTKMAYKGTKNLAKWGWKKIFGKADDVAAKVDLPAGKVEFSDGATASAERLGFDVSDVSITDGVADVPIIFTSEVNLKDISDVTSSLKSAGAASMRIDTGPIINGTISSRIQKALDSGKTFLGFNISKTGENMFELTKSLE